MQASGKLSPDFSMKTESNPEHALKLAREVLRIESEAVQEVAARLDSRLVEAIQLILHCKGRVVVTGMGKSGHIARKIASTFASTGTPAFFVHPGEASHGDLGMITDCDVVIALSNSGESSEIVTILPLIKRKNAHLIALTGKPESTLARAADVHLDVSVAREACPLNLAPTASTTAALALGDALAVALLDARGFSAEDFAQSHPGGALGRRLLILVSDIMRTGEHVPRASAAGTIKDALFEISRKGLGMTAVVGNQDSVIGIFTDGDLRRAFERGLGLDTPLQQAMTLGPQTIAPERLAAEAVALMDEKKINALLVVDANDALVGALNMHDLLRAGVV